MSLLWRKSKQRVTEEKSKRGKKWKVQTNFTTSSCQMKTVAQTVEEYQQWKFQTPPLFKTLMQTAMNHAHSSLSRSKSACQLSMSGIISHDETMLRPPVILHLQKLVPVFLYDCLYCMQQFKQLYISMKSSINTLL